MNNTIVTKFFNIENEDLEKAKKIDRSTDLNNKWYGLNATDTWGCMTYLYRKYNYPTDVADFYKSYVSDKKTDNLKEFGRNEDYIMRYAQLLSNRDDKRYTIKEYYSYILKKLMCDTIDGCKKEKELNDYILSKGFTTESPTINEDLNLGIDLKIYKNDKLICLLQAKPRTFFLGDRNTTLINDRKKALIKEQKAIDTYKVPVYYCIYDKVKGWIKNKRNGLCFRLKNLINNDGTTKN